MQDGEEVSIKGTVVYGGRTLQAPFSKRRCVYYYVKVVENKPPKSHTHYDINIKEQRAADIVLFDGEHYALIDNKLIVAYVLMDEHQRSGFFNLSSDELEAFLKKHKQRTKNGMGWSLELSAEEGVIVKDESVTVAGKATWVDSDKYRLNIPNTKILYLQALNENGVYITDDLV